MSETPIEEVAMYHQVVQLGQNHNVPIISGPTIISAANTSTTANTSVNVSDTPFYVVMTPNTEILGHTVTNANRRRSGGDSRGPRDEKRRTTHNEVNI